MFNIVIISVFQLQRFMRERETVKKAINNSIKRSKRRWSDRKSVSLNVYWDSHFLLPYKHVCDLSLSSCFNGELPLLSGFGRSFAVLVPYQTYLWWDISRFFTFCKTVLRRMLGLLGICRHLKIKNNPTYFHQRFSWNVEFEHEQFLCWAGKIKNHL